MFMFLTLLSIYYISRWPVTLGLSSRQGMWPSRTRTTEPPSVHKPMALLIKLTEKELNNECRIINLIFATDVLEMLKLVLSYFNAHFH